VGHKDVITYADHTIVLQRASQLVATLLIVEQKVCTKVSVHCKRTILLQGPDFLDTPSEWTAESLDSVKELKRKTTKVLHQMHGYVGILPPFHIIFD
jgi:hypothetical protein